MRERKEEVLAALDTLSSILSRWGEYKWAKQVERHRNALARSYNARNIESALGLFRGGMGSFNDAYPQKEGIANLEKSLQEFRSAQSLLFKLLNAESNVV